MSRNKRSKREAEPDEEEDYEERMPYFVPEEGIDIEPLALYTRSILDGGAQVKVGEHPQRKTEKGWWIISSVPVSREDIAAMITDTRSWRRESKTGHYVNSDTARRRLKQGRAEQGRSRMAVQRKASKETEEQEVVQQMLSGASLSERHPGSHTRSSNPQLDHLPQMSSPSPRPASAQPVSTAGGRHAPVTGYTVPASSPQIQYSTYSSTEQRPLNPLTKQYANMDDRMEALGAKVAGGDEPNQPSTTGTHGFNRPAPTGLSSSGSPGAHQHGLNEPTTYTTTQPSTTGSHGYTKYTTSGGPPKPRAPNQGQRRHG